MEEVFSFLFFTCCLLREVMEVEVVMFLFSTDWLPRNTTLLTRPRRAMDITSKSFLTSYDKSCSCFADRG